MPGSYHAYQWTQWGSRYLPGALSAWAAERLADVQWRHQPPLRAQVAHNLSLALGTCVEADHPLVRDVFRSFARYLAEFFAMDRHRPDVTFEGQEHLQRLAAQPQGVIVLTTHVGNWELGGVTLNRLGYPLTGIVLPHADARTDALFIRQRARCGMNTLPLGTHALREALSALRARRWLGLIADRDFTGHGVPVTWGARRVVLPSGPALLSLHAQAPILPMAFVREGLWRFRLLIEPPILPPAVRRTWGEVTALTQRCADVLQKHLRRFAGQWAVFEPLPEMR